jgi:MFS family permease
MRQTKTIWWFIFLIISLFYCYEFFLRISPGILVNQLIMQYHANATDIGAFASSYYTGYVLMQIPAGMLYDRYPFKWVTVIALLCCVFGSMVFTFSYNIYFGLIGRFILGCGSAFAFIGAITFARIYLPTKHFTLLVALVISLGTIFAAFGQVFAVKIIQYLHWQLTIEGMAGWGIILALVIALIPKQNFHRIDNQESVTWGCIAKQFKSIAQRRIVWLNGLIGSLFYLPTSIIAATWGVELFTKAYGFSIEQGSYVITLLFIGWALGGPFFGWLVDKIGREKLILSIAATLAAVIILIILFGSYTNPAFIYAAIFVFGIASSAQVLVWHIFSVAICEKRLVGTASSFTNLLIMVSIAVWDLVLGRMIDTLHHDFSAASANFTASDLRWALISLPVLIMLDVLLSQFLPNFEAMKARRRDLSR